MDKPTQEEETKLPNKECENNGIWRVPGMQSAWYFTTITYNTIKDSNTTNWALNSVKETTVPVFNSLVKPIAIADRTLWSGLTTIKVYLPLVAEAPWKLHGAIGPTLQTISTAKDFSTQMAKDLCNCSWEKANEISGLCYTLYRPISANVGNMVVHDIVSMLYNRQGINEIWPVMMTRYVQSAVGVLNTHQKIFPNLEAKFIFIPFPGTRLAIYVSLSCDI